MVALGTPADLKTALAARQPELASPTMADVFIETIEAIEALQAVRP
jgi:hypothetical protein